MYVVTGYLYKNNNLLLKGAWENLQNFVEELKILNPRFVDRREFMILFPDGTVCKKWNRK